MNKRKREYQNYLFGEEILFSFVYSKSKDGLVIAPRIKGKNCHLTIYLKDDKIISHTTIVDGGHKEYWNHNEITKTDFVQGILKQFKNSVKPYRKRKSCRTLSDEFKETVLQKTGLFTTEVDFLKLSSINDDIEILKDKVIKKTKIIDLLGDQIPIGFGRKRIFVPINNKQMMALQEDTFQKTFDFILESLGITSYYEQLFNTSEGKQILSDLKKLVGDSTILTDEVIDNV